MAPGCQRRARSVLLPPTPRLIFSFHGFEMKSNYSLVIFTDSQGTINRCIRDRVTVTRKATPAQSPSSPR